MRGLFSIATVTLLGSNLDLLVIAGPGGEFLLGTLEGKLTYRTWTRVSETLRRVKEFIHESQTVVFGL